jgi:anti-sigma factor RsiW
MDCKYVADKVWLYVEGDLGKRQHQAVTRHVASCRQCAGAVEEARDSQEWLKSFEPARFDEGFMADVRNRARNKVAEVESSRLRSVRTFARLNWKPLIIACPSLLLVCWFAVRWASENRRNYGDASPGARADVFPRKQGDKTSDAAAIVGSGKIKDQVVAQHRHRIKKRVEAAIPGKVEDRDLVSASRLTSAPPLRIEIQTEDPNVRIIWFASPSDGSVPFGPER